MSTKLDPKYRLPLIAAHFDERLIKEIERQPISADVFDAVIPHITALRNYGKHPEGQGIPNGMLRPTGFSHEEIKDIIIFSGSGDVATALIESIDNFKAARFQNFDIVNLAKVDSADNLRATGRQAKSFSDAGLTITQITDIVENAKSAKVVDFVGQHIGEQPTKGLFPKVAAYGLAMFSEAEMRHKVEHDYPALLAAFNEPTPESGAAKLESGVSEVAVR